MRETLDWSLNPYIIHKKNNAQASWETLDQSLIPQIIHKQNNTQAYSEANQQDIERALRR
jgi:hypothetical protein